MAGLGLTFHIDEGGGDEDHVRDRDAGGEGGGGGGDGGRRLRPEGRSKTTPCVRSDELPSTRPTHDHIPKREVGLAAESSAKETPNGVVPPKKGAVGRSQNARTLVTRVALATRQIEDLELPAHLKNKLCKHGESSSTIRT